MNKEVQKNEKIEKVKDSFNQIEKNKLSKELNFKEIIFIQYHIKKAKYLVKTYSIDFKKNRRQWNLLCSRRPL